MSRLTAKELTGAEKLHIKRKRMGYSQVQMSVDLGVCLGEYIAMEMGQEPAVAPYITLHGVSELEIFTAMRRRQNWSRSELAAEMDLSAEWVRKMETGQAPVKKLELFWEKFDAVG